jgi:hypothetical protein
MKIGQLTIKIMVFTTGCFLLSYAASVLGHVNDEKPYPQSLAKVYSSRGQDLAEVSIRKNVPAAHVAELTVAGVHTDIELQAAGGDQITVELNGEFPGGGDPLEILTEGDRITIKIKERKEKDSFFNFNWDSGESHLTLGVPKSIKGVVAKSVSGDVEISGLKLERVKLETVSGDSHVNEAGISVMEIKSVSGDVNADGAIGKFEGHSVSGDIHVQFTNNAPDIDLKTTSGDTLVAFKEKPDLKVQFSSISGGFTMDHAFGDTEIEGRKFSLNLGAGKGNLSVKTISGDVRIEKF